MNHNAEPTIACLTDLAAEQMLVVAAKNGDEQAFETLFKRHQRKILRIVLRYAHVREDAEDIVQQSFQKAFVHLCKFEGKSSFSTWLTRIAINEALMFLRSIGAVREVPIDDTNDADGSAGGFEIPDSSPDPEASYLRLERAQILSETLGNLRPGMRKAIELRELAELSTEETARLMGVSVPAVKARLFHAKKKLQEKLSSYLKSNSTHGKSTTDIGDTGGRILRNPLCNASGL
jgi:RNA polymerase sigma-70 factor (ECF subfamily)